MFQKSWKTSIKPNQNETGFNKTKGYAEEIIVLNDENGKGIPKEKEIHRGKFQPKGTRGGPNG